MDVYKIEISDSAKKDIKDTALYIMHDLQEPELAEKFTERIIDTVSTLEDMPFRIALVKDVRLAKMQTRGLIIDNHTAFFRINETKKTIVIIRVMYSRRDWQTLL